MRTMKLKVQAQHLATDAPIAICNTNGHTAHGVGHAAA